MIKAPSIALASVATLVLSGCGSSFVADRRTNPVVQDFTVKWFSDTTSLSTTASRRLAIMVYQTDDNGKKSMVTCAEPPPDVGETFAKALAAQLEFSAPTQVGEVKAGVSFADKIATAIAPLMVRSQGLQILRDSAYTLCIDRMNGWIKDPETYMRIKQDRFDKAISLVKDELPFLPKRVAVPLAPPDLPTGATLPAAKILTPAAPASAASSVGAG